MKDYTAYLERLGLELASPSVRAGFAYWRGLLKGRRFPKRRDIDPTAIPQHLLRITLIDVHHAPLDFRVRLLGEYVRKNQGGAPGARVADTVNEAQARDKILARLTLCVEQRRPIRGLYRYVPRNRPRVTLWVECLSCPLSEDGERVDNIVSFGADHDFTVPAGTKEIP